MLAVMEDVRINEPAWALWCVRHDRKPRFSIGQAKKEYENARTLNMPLAKELSAEVWDRLAMRLVVAAKTAKDLEEARKQCRFESEPYNLSWRKLARIKNREAMAATTIADTYARMQEVCGDLKPSRQVSRKFTKMLRHLAAAAQTLEDYQRLHYYAHGDLGRWAEAQWDRLSQAEVDAAQTIQQAYRAYLRATMIWLDDIKSFSLGRSDAVVAKSAEAKWDNLALEAVQQATYKMTLYRLLYKSRKGSLAERRAYLKLMKECETFDAGYKLYLSLYRRKSGVASILRGMTVFQLAQRCETAAHAAKLWGEFNVPAVLAVELIKKFPNLTPYY